MRQLLLIEAAAYPKPNIRPLLREKRVRARQLMGFSPDEPEIWRVRFRCFTHPSPDFAQRKSGAQDHERQSVWAPGSPLARRPGDECRRAPVTFRSAWPLAERYEALIRVFNDPTNYAQRLARRLHATPHRVVEVLSYTEESWARVGGEHRGALDAEVRQARRRWDSS
jgi:hypothetical protein